MFKKILPKNKKILMLDCNFQKHKDSRSLKNLKNNNRFKHAK